MNADGTEVIEVTVGKYDWHGDSLVAWSPDSQKIGYFLEDTGSGDPFGIYIMNADGSEQTLVYEGEIDQLAWSPDGKQIAFTHECQINVIDIDGSNLVTLADGCIGRKSYEAVYFHAISWNR